MSVAPTRVALSLMPGEAFAAATYPLFAAGEVDALEWTYELGFGSQALPPHLDGLLNAYAGAGALSLHGVSASMLGPEPPRWQDTLTSLRALAARLRPARVSEHFGFEYAPGFVRGTVFPTPCGEKALAHAHRRLAQLGEATGAAVGLENLAFAFSRRDVEAEPELLERILAPLDGFVVLDLHNLYCRARNFALDPRQLLARYPAHRVRELHVSGGSDSPVEPRLGGGKVRRDTHDGVVPEAVLELLAHALGALPQVDTVVVERLPSSLDDEPARAGFRDDFRRVRRVVAEAGR